MVHVLLCPEARVYRRRPWTHLPRTMVPPDCPCYLHPKRTSVALGDLLGPLLGEVARDGEEDHVAGARRIKRELLDLEVACSRGGPAQCESRARHTHRDAGVGCRTPPRVHGRARCMLCCELPHGPNGVFVSLQCVYTQCALAVCMAVYSPNGVFMSLPAERADAKSLSSDTGKPRLPEIV